MILDIIHKQWETRGDILVIQGFAYKLSNDTTPKSEGSADGLIDALHLWRNKDTRLLSRNQCHGKV